MRKQLLLGAGTRRQKLLGITVNGVPDDQWGDLTTIDIDPLARPDVLHDLNVRPLPFESNTFDELHAYEVLEHLGRQGDWRGFLDEFAGYWRVLKSGGLLCATCPSRHSAWAWGDPGHVRLIQPETLLFLSQRAYQLGVGVTPMTDYRAVYHADFELLEGHDDGETFRFILRAIKE